MHDDRLLDARITNGTLRSEPKLTSKEMLSFLKNYSCGIMHVIEETLRSYSYG